MLLTSFAGFSLRVCAVTRVGVGGLGSCLGRCAIWETSLDKFPSTNFGNLCCRSFAWWIFRNHSLDDLQTCSDIFGNLWVDINIHFWILLGRWCRLDFQWCPWIHLWCQHISLDVFFPPDLWYFSIWWCFILYFRKAWASDVWKVVGRSKALFRIQHVGLSLTQFEKRCVCSDSLLEFSVGHFQICMEVPEDSGKEEYWVTVGRLVDQSPFLRDIWFWFSLAVRITAFLTVHERHRFFLVSRYIYFERCEVAFGVTELRLGIQVDCWEVCGVSSCRGRDPRITAWTIATWRMMDPGWPVVPEFIASFLSRNFVHARHLDAAFDTLEECEGTLQQHWCCGKRTVVVHWSVLGAQSIQSIQGHHIGWRWMPSSEGQMWTCTRQTCRQKSQIPHHCWQEIQWLVYGLWSQIRQNPWPSSHPWAWEQPACHPDASDHGLVVSTSRLFCVWSCVLLATICIEGSRSATDSALCSGQVSCAWSFSQMFVQSACLVNMLIF